jgi:hypothetical protein
MNDRLAIFDLRSNRHSSYSGLNFGRRDGLRAIMTDPLISKADQYRQEAAKCYELAEAARPAYLGDVYRRVAIRYLFMAEELSRWPERRGPPSLDALLPSTRTTASNL